MDAKTRLYTTVKECIESITLTGGEKLVKHFSVWNNNILGYDKNTAHGFPAVFYKIHPIEWETRNQTLGNPNHERVARASFELHTVVSSQLNNDGAYRKAQDVNSIIFMFIEKLSNENVSCIKLVREYDGDSITSVVEVITVFEVLLNQPAVESSYTIVEGVVLNLNVGSMPFGTENDSVFIEGFNDYAGRTDPAPGDVSLKRVFVAGDDNFVETVTIYDIAVLAATKVPGNLQDEIDALDERLTVVEGDIGDIETVIGQIQQALLGKQDTLVSGTNIKTINGNSLLGSGDIEIQGGGGGASSAYIYASNIDSSVSGYKTLSYSVDVAETEFSGVVNSSETLVKNFLFPAVIDLTSIQTGIVPLVISAKTSSVTQTSYIKIVAFLRHADSTETEIFTATSQNIDSTDYVDISFNHAISTFITTSLTDRFGIRVYVGTTRSSNTTVSFHVGDGTPLYLSLPIPIAHDVTRRKNENLGYQHIDQTTEKTTVIDDDSVALWDSVAFKFVRTTLTNLKTWVSNIYQNIILPTSNGYSGTVMPYQYGATLAFGNIAYTTLVNSVSVLKLAANTSSDTCKAMFVIATSGVSGDTKNVILPGSFIYDSSVTFTDGLPVYIDSSGKPTTTPPAVGSNLYAQVVGRAVGIHCWYFQPSGLLLGLV